MVVSVVVGFWYMSVYFNDFNNMIPVNLIDCSV
jgi:hypothetical protein